MTVFVTLVLLALTVAVVGYPLFRKHRESLIESAEDEQLTELYSKRDSTYSAIKELEFDLSSGSLSKEDYGNLEASYKMKAISLLKDIDDLEKGTRVDDEIERQILELRQTKGDLEKGTGVDEDIERQVQKLRQAGGVFCPQCGASSQKGDKFCFECGTRLPLRRRSK
jgi:hypothetical protein